MSDLSRYQVFFAETDRLKAERRACWIYSERRNETVAEHVWHTTLLALLNRDIAPAGVDPNHVRDLLTVHDLVEVYAGDTSAWDEAGNEGAAEREQAAGERLFALLPSGSAPHAWMNPLWQEFQAQETVAAQYARALDSIHPMINSWSAGSVGHPLDLTPFSYQSSRKRAALDRFDSIREVSCFLIQGAVAQGLMPAGEIPIVAETISDDAARFIGRVPFMVATDVLKQEFRANHTLSEYRNESVAEHCWHTTLLAMLWTDVAPPDVDINHVLDLLVAHDLVEVYAGDIDVALIVDPDVVRADEEASAQRLLELLPDEASRSVIGSLVEEYLELTSPDARFARAIDVMHPLLLTWGHGSHIHPEHLEKRPSVARTRERKMAWIEPYPEMIALLDGLETSAIRRGEADV